MVVRRGGRFGRDTLVPVEWVREIRQDTIVLDVPLARLEELPEYRPDDEITADVLNVLWYHSNFKDDDLRYVEVQTRDAIVELGGTTTTEAAKAAIEAAARRVRGVIGMRNRIQSIEALALAARESRPAANGQPSAHPGRG